MRTTKFFTLLTLLLGAFHLSGIAQVTNDLDLSTNEELVEAAKREVGSFTKKLSSIVVPKQSPNNRRLLKEGALYLFIGKGEDYYTYVYDSLNNPIDTIKNKAVKMQTTTLRDTTIRKDTPMAEYLSRMVKDANNRKYTYVTIVTTDWKEMKTSKIRKLGDGRYVISVYFDQWYKEWYFIDSGGVVRKRRLYGGDKTTKRVECYIDISDTDFGRKVIIRLGDILAEETRPYDL